MAELQVLALGVTGVGEGGEEEGRAGSPGPGDYSLMRARCSARPGIVVSAGGADGMRLHLMHV